MIDLCELARNGVKKFHKALKKFFRDSQIVSEIYDRVDKEVFLPATQDERYRYIEDINEDNIFDSFIELCFQNASLDIDIPLFVKEHFAMKTDEAQKYIINFFEKVSREIYEVLKVNVSFESKLIIKGQEIAAQTILDRLSTIESKLNNVIVVTYSANMQGKNWTLSRAINSRIDISMNNFPLMPENNDSFWNLEQKSLIETFNRKISSYLEDGYIVDLYALAPIPLLVQLGNLFANRPNINIFQLKKVPSTFEWEENGDKLNIKTNKPLKDEIKQDVALVLSFSDRVNRNNVRKVIGNEMPIAEMYIDEPFDDFLRAKNQLNEFLLEYRKVKSFLTSNGVKRIHLFAAIPIAFAIGIGQAYNPNYDADIVTYDFKQGNYNKALTIGGNHGS